MILDDFSETRSREPFKVYIPFTIACILVAIPFIDLLISSLAEWKLYVMPIYVDRLIGWIGLLITTLLLLFKKPAWKVSFAIISLTAVTPLASFGGISLSVAFVDLIHLPIALMHLYWNIYALKSIREFFNGSPEEKQETSDRNTQRFVDKFSSKSDTELQRIVDENFLVPEAVAAAQQLLEARQRPANIPEGDS